MTPQCFVLTLAVALCLCATVLEAAVTPLAKPGMAVKVEAGSFRVGRDSVKLAADVTVAVEPPDRVRVTSEEQVLSDDKGHGWAGGTALAKTLGPVDTGTRLPKAIVPESVKIHSTADGGTVYVEDKDYGLDHFWGSVWRIPSGSIAKDAKVYVDYEVELQRIDVVQIAADGTVSVKKGKAAPVNAAIPAPAQGQTRLANLYVPYRTTAITLDNILPPAPRRTTWKNFVRVSGRENLKNTRELLKGKKPVTVVCWGDSVTEGGSPSKHENCYVERFRTLLKESYPETPITLINAGIGGSNTDSRRDGFEKEVLAHNPDLITMEFVNDLGMPAEHIVANYAEFIGKARKKNPKVEWIILTPHLNMREWAGNYVNSIPAVRKAAKDNNVALGDSVYIWESLDQVGIPYESLLANGINHPNDLGHEFFAETLMKLMGPGK